MSVQGCDGHHEVWPVSIFRDSGMFTADSTSPIDSCLAEGRLYSEDSLTCSAASDLDDIFVGLVVSSKELTYKAQHCSASCKYLSRPFDTLSRSDCTSSFEATAPELSGDKVGYNEP